MPIGERNGIRFARVQIGGRRIEQSLGRGASKEEAKELESALRKRLRDDRHAKRVGQSLNRTFGEALITYLKLPETARLKSYKSLRSVAKLVKEHLVSVPLENITEKTEEMKQAFIAEGLQNGTINRRLALVRRIVRLAHRQWKWLVSPVEITLLPEDNERHIYPEVEFVYSLLDHCPSKEDADAILAIYFTGVRKGEFLRINRNPERYVRGNFIELYTGNKTKKPGRIPIVEQIKPIIERLPLKVTDWSIRVNFETARAAVNREDLHLHDLRHGFASNIIEAGGDLVDVMKVLRHSSSQTSKRYVHLLDKRLKRIAGKVSKLATTAEKRRSDKQEKKLKVVKSA
jgi:integrase